MRAVVVHEFGPIDSHSLEDVPDPTPGPEDVLVDVHAIGFASGRIPEAKAGYFNVKNLTMAGMALDLHFRFAPELIREAVADVFDMCLSGRIRPEITATYALEEFQSAMGLFAARKSIGKMVLTTGRDG